MRVVATLWRLFPLTPLGVLVLAGSLFAFFYFGLEQIDLLLLTVGIVGIALVLVTAVLVVVAAAILFRHLRKRSKEDGAEHALQLECGYPRRTGFGVPNLWFLPFVRVGWSWQEPLVHLHLFRHGLSTFEEVAALERCSRSTIRRRFDVADSFGLTRVRFDVEQTTSLKCYPAAGNLRQVHVVRSMAAGDQFPHPEGPAQGERVDMRHYSPGDPIRFILWKVFARTRQLVVRTPERAFGPIRQTVAYLVRGELDEPAAGAARVAIDCNALSNASGDWVLGTDGHRETASTARHALELLAGSGEVPYAKGGSGLDDFLQEAMPGGAFQILLFVPGKPGPWLPRVLASLARNRAVRTEAMVCVDGVRTPHQKSPLRRVLTQHKERLDPRKGVGPTHASDLEEVCRKLARAGVIPTVLDRVQGRVYGPGHQQALFGTQANAAQATLKSQRTEAVA